MVCELDVCDELDECPSDVYVNDCDGNFTDDETGVTLLRDGVAKAHAEEMAWYGKFKADGGVPDETSVKNGTQTDLPSMDRHQGR